MEHPELGENDVLAFLDVLIDFARETEHMTVDRALDVKGWLVELQTHLRSVLAIVDQRLMTVAAEPVLSHGLMVYAEPQVKAVTDHTALRRLLRERAMFNADGERITDPEEAARRAIELTYEALVVPSDVPAARALKALKIKRAEVIEEKANGHKLKMTPVKGLPE